MKQTRNKSNSKSTTKKTKFTFKKSNVIMEDKHKNSQVKIISDKEEPFLNMRKNNGNIHN